MSNRDRLPIAVTHQVRDTCLCLHLQRATRAVTRKFDEALRPLHLTSGQFSLLMSLNRAEAPSIGQVSAVLAMDRTTLNANLKPLERRGLLRVSVDHADRRSRRLALTPAGRSLLVRALPIWKRTQAATENLLGRSHPDTVRDDLRKLSQPGPMPARHHTDSAPPRDIA
jgi:DNA-binding MarR family transcriptional regulator